MINGLAPGTVNIGASAPGYGSTSESVQVLGSFTLAPANLTIAAINRPEAMNALNVELSRAIDAAAEDAEADRDILVLIVVGEGGRVPGRGGLVGDDLGLIRSVQGHCDASGPACFPRIGEVANPPFPSKFPNGCQERVR